MKHHTYIIEYENPNYTPLESSPKIKMLEVRNCYSKSEAKFKANRKLIEKYPSLYENPKILNCEVKE